MINELMLWQKRLAEQRQEYSKYCNSQDEQELVNVIFEVPAIKNVEDERKVKIDLLEALGKWSYMTGSKPPGEKELFLMTNFVFDNYATLNVKEIDYSMNLCMTGKLDCDPSTYGFFSPAYVARVLNAYIEYKENMSKELAIKKLNEDMRRQMEEEAKKEETPEQKLERLRFWIRECKDNIDLNAELVDYGNFVYDFLKAKKLIRLTKDEIIQAKLYAAQRYANFYQDGINPALAVSEDGEKNRYAREWCLRKFFDTYDCEELCQAISVEDLISDVN